MNAASARWSAFRRVGEDRDLRRALAAFSAFSITEFGTWVTVLVYAYSVGDAATVGTVAVAQLVPAAVLAPILATRLDRLTRAVAAMVAFGSQAVALAATSAAMLLEAPPVLTFAFAVVANITVAMGRPAHNSLIPELVKDADHLTAANVVTTSAENIGVFLGPALAGLMMGVASPGLALAALVLVMTAGTALVTGIPRVQRALTPPSLGATKPREARYRGALPFVIIGGAQQVVIGALDVLIVLLAIGELGLGDAGAAYLNAALGLGGVLGGLAAAGMVGRARLTPTLAVGVALRSVSLILIGFFPAAALFLAGTGIGYSVVDVANRTLLQRSVPVEGLAAAFGLLESAAMASLAIGSALAPVLTGLVGTTQAFAVIGLVMPLILVIAWKPLRRAERQASLALEALAILQDVAMFAGLEPAVQEAIGRAGVMEDARTGVPVVVEEEAGDRMWIIADGSVDVSKGGQVIATLGKGDVFGEIALLSDRPRISTVTPTEPTRLLALDRTGFLAALATDAVTRAGFEDLARRRTHQTLGE